MNRRGSVLIAAILLVLVLSVPAVYAASCSDWVARVDSFHGKVQAKVSGNEEWTNVSPRDQFCAGDMLRVAEKSRAVIVLRNETVMRLDQNTTVTLSAQTKEKPSLLDLLKGAAYFISRTPQKFRVNTPFLNAGIEGTEFVLTVYDTATFVTVFEGIVLAENSTGSTRVTTDQTAMAGSGQTPEIQVYATPRNAVQWALYYPPIFKVKGIEAAEEWQRQVTSLLSAGRLDDSAFILGHVLQQEPNNSSALALHAIINIARNENDKALENAKAAVAADPKSASALLALSYARQAHFDLKGALDSLKEAVKTEPGNSLIWARLSEVRLSLGEKDESLKAAEKAVSIAPELSRTQSVLGFAHLAELRTDEAMTAFEKAAGLDPSDPLPRLGLGLAKIRKGQLEEGRREIEIAVSLDPNNALLRSYLGKAYHEEKRGSVAAKQFSMAKTADPKDPTAFFYSALQKQAENMPVEALQDLERSMELNDNRAVYRSRLLLDEDQAARSASLARIYDDLGFQQLALSEGYKSVNADPANAAAHRFLSDSYAALPRHEIARVSELLQAQLLQPVGLNPVQPHLAESGLFILQGAGPADAGFNEYNQLFNRNRISLLMSGVAGSNSTYGDELVVAGVHEKVAFSVGQFHYETDGFRKNNDQKQDIHNIFAQVSVTPQTSAQVEFRSRDMETGFLQLIFDPNFVIPGYRENRDFRSVRLGLHHVFSSGSDLIASVIHHNGEMGYKVTGANEVANTDGYLAEVQHLFRSERLNIISGIGHFRENRKSEADFFGMQFTSKSNPSHDNYYVYSQINPVRELSLTVGASADFFKGKVFDQSIERRQFNPKLGLTWSVLPGTVLRAAAFRTLRRSLLTDQTIEPTQVAGFDQFFDEDNAEGTRAWRYGVGIDQKFSAQIYGGAEFSMRDLKVFRLDSEWGVPGECDWNEQLGRAYLYWSPHKSLALSAEYQHQLFKRPRDFAGDNFTELSTNRLLLGMGYYHPGGFSARLQAVYVDQRGTFIDIFSFTDTYKDNDRFWIANASMSYRLSKQNGIISLEAKNLFNKHFKFQDTDPSNPSLYPERLILAKFTLVF